MTQKITVGIIGTGRFATVLRSLFAQDSLWEVKQYSTTKSVDGKIIFPMSEIAQCELIIPAVPISAFKTILKKLKDEIPPHTSPLVISICSVMSHPQRWLMAELPESVDILMTHPMFGPHSTQNGTEFGGRSLVWNPIRIAKKSRLKMFKYFLERQGIRLIPMHSDHHDQIMAQTQFVSFLFGQIGIELGLQSTRLDTQGFTHLLKNQAIVKTDTRQLFINICVHNPYAKKQLHKVSEILREFEKEVGRI
ncbi:MAG: prephenate dehydrogenase/arogenate dehydrogenase family protein [Patescibacteria group bacterium]